MFKSYEQHGAHSHKSIALFVNNGPRPNVHAQCDMVATQKDKTVAGSNLKIKRPNNYWAPFTSWWRSRYEVTRKRPTIGEIRQ